VRWFVLKEPVTMSSGQVEMYSSIFDGITNRPVQPLQGRDVITNTAPAMAH
jgi:carbonic anhydrase